MKKLLLTLCILSVLTGNATTYYFSSASSAQGSGTLASPFSRLSILDSILKGKWSGITAPGNTFLLRKGDFFYGTLTPSVNGTASLPVTISTYTDNNSVLKPTISSFYTVPASAWTSLGGNKYKTSLPTGSSVPQFVTMSDATTPDTYKFKAIGRWPNAGQTTGGATYGGWLAYENAGGVAKATGYTIYDKDWGTYTKPKDLTGATTTFSGAEIAVRINDFRFINSSLDMALTGTGTTQSATFTLDAYQDNITNNHGYFILNHPDCLDVDGEWAYDPVAQELYIYSTVVPTTAGRKVQMSTKDILINLSSVSFYNITGIGFTGANLNSIQSDGTGRSDIHLDSLDIRYSKKAALYARYVLNLSLTNSVIDSSLTEGIYLVNNGAGDDTALISDNVISNTFPIYGMSYKGDPLMGYAIKMQGTRIGCYYNKWINSGYTAIDFEQGNNQWIYYNITDGTQTMLCDGGALYCNNQVYEDQWQTNRYVGYNILKNTDRKTDGRDNTGGLMGATGYSMALYADQSSRYIHYIGNTVIGGRVQLFMNDPVSMEIRDNMFFNWGTSSGAGGNSAVEFRASHYANEPYSFQSVTRTQSLTGPSLNVMRNNVFFDTASSTTAPKAYWATTKSHTATVLRDSVYVNSDSNFYVYPRNSTSTTWFKVDPFVYVSGAEKQNSQLSFTLAERRASPYNDEQNTKASPKYYTSNTIASGGSYFRFLVNETKSPITYQLDNKNWITVRGDSVLSNSLTIQPFHSEVLLYLSDQTGTVNNPTTVTLTGPTDGSTYSAPGSIPITSTASDADGIDRVEFYADGSLIGTDLASPYNFTWNNVPAATYDLSVIAFDKLGNQKESLHRTVTVNPVVALPLVTLATDTTVYLDPVSIPLTALARSQGGTTGYISKVQFFNGSTLIGTIAVQSDVNTPVNPYVFNWNFTFPGTYNIKAVATDELGQLGTSNIIPITIKSTTASATNGSYKFRKLKSIKVINK